jgi:DNA polymerase-1
LFRELEFTALLKYVTQEPEKGSDYKTVLAEEDFQTLLNVVPSAKELSLDTETTSLDPLTAELVGISFSFQPHQAYYLPLGHTYKGAPKQIGLDRALAAFKPVLENPAIKKIGQNLKYDLLVLGQYDVAVQGAAFDTMIASYLLNPSKPSHSLEAIALEYLNYKVTTYADVTGSGKKQIGFNEVDIEKATRYSGEDADIALRLQQTLRPRLEEQGLEKLFREIEMPLMEVLVAMERAGVKVDAHFLGTMSKKLEKEAAKIEKNIYELSG